MAEQQKILCIGSIMVDVLCPLDCLPQPGEGVVAKKNKITLGGCTYNTARIVRQAGGDCALLAPVGRGPFGNYVREQLLAEGLEPWNVDEDTDMGVALCLLEPNGERTMISLPGIESEFKREWLQGYDASAYDVAEVCGYEIHASGGEAIVAFLEQHPSMQVVFAPGPVIAQLDPNLIERINALHPIWHLNYAEATAYTDAVFVEDAGQIISKACNNAVIVTKGAQGCWLFEGESITHIPTTSVNAMDTTGAGDAHVGAIMAKRAQGASWEESLTFANAVSGEVCQTLGASLPDETVARLVGMGE